MVELTNEDLMEIEGGNFGQVLQVAGGALITGAGVAKVVVSKGTAGWGTIGAGLVTISGAFV